MNKLTDKNLIIELKSSLEYLRKRREALAKIGYDNYGVREIKNAVAYILQAESILRELLEEGK